MKYLVLLCRNVYRDLRSNWLRYAAHLFATGVVFLLALFVVLGFASLFIAYDLTSYHPVGETVPWGEYALSIAIAVLVSLILAAAFLAMGLVVERLLRSVSIWLKCALFLGTLLLTYFLIHSPRAASELPNFLTFLGYAYIAAWVLFYGAVRSIFYIFRKKMTPKRASKKRTSNK